MIQFKNITLEGFRSFSKSTTFSFDMNGMVHVAGVNGAGKTSLFEGLFWCLYGKAFRPGDVTTLPDYQHPGFNGTRVGVELMAGEIPVKIERRETHNKSEVILHISGERFPAPLKTTTQSKIEELLKMNSSVFLKVAFFGKASPAFAELSDELKKQVIEEFFDMGWVDQALVKAKVSRDLQMNELSKVESAYKALEVIITQTGNSISEEEVMIENFETNRVDSIIKIRERMEMVKVEEPRKLREVQDLGDLEASIKEQTSRYTNLVQNARIDRSRISIVQPKEPSLTNCEKCGQPIDQVEYEKQLQLYKDKVAQVELNKLEIERLETIINSPAPDFTVDIDVIEQNNKIIQENRLSEQWNSLLDSRNKSALSLLSSLQGELIQIQESKPDDSKLIRLREGLVTSTRDFESLKKEANEIKSLLEKTNWWVSKGFSPHGVKSFMMDSLLVKLNENIALYSSKLGVLIQFSMDLDKARTKMVMECYKADGCKIDIGSLSDGERQKLDLAIFLGMHDLITEVYNKTNILVIDEMMSHISAESITEAFDLLRSKPVEQVYVITHTSVDSLYLKTITFNKENGQTTIEKPY